MLIESLVKSTVELQGFRVTTVNYDGDQLEAKLAPTGVTCLVVGNAIGRPCTETLADLADSATCRCGGFRWTSATRLAGSTVSTAGAFMWNPYPGSPVSDGSPMP